MRLLRRVLVYVMAPPSAMPSNPKSGDISSFMVLSLQWMGFGSLVGMNRESIENIALFLLSSFLVGVMVAVGFLLITGIPAFARFLFIVWYVLIV